MKVANDNQQIDPSRQILQFISLNVQFFPFKKYKIMYMLYVIYNSQSSAHVYKIHMVI